MKDFNFGKYAEWLGSIAFEFYSKYGLPKEMFLDRLFSDPEKVKGSIIKFLEYNQQNGE